MFITEQKNILVLKSPKLLTRYKLYPIDYVYSHTNRNSKDSMHATQRVRNNYFLRRRGSDKTQF